MSLRREKEVFFRATPFVCLLALGLWALPCWLQSGRTSADTSVHFEDITHSAGISFTHYTGAFGKKYLPETMGSGCAFIDYDNDGNPDILLVQGGDFADHPSNQRRTLKLYHNNGNKTFTDVTARSGLGIEFYGMGVAAGDYDNDGWDDIYLTGLGAHTFFTTSTTAPSKILPAKRA